MQLDERALRELEFVKKSLQTYALTPWKNSRMKKLSGELSTFIDSVKQSGGQIPEGTYSDNIQKIVGDITDGSTGLEAFGRYVKRYRYRPVGSLPTYNSLPRTRRFPRDDSIPLRD